MDIQTLGRRAFAVILNYKDNANTLKLAAMFVRCGRIDRVAVVDCSESGGLTGNEQALQDERVCFLATSNGGYSRGNNQGIYLLEKQFGSPAYYIISNPDIQVSEQAVEECLSFLENNAEYAVAAPRMYRPDGKPHHLSGWKERSFLCDLAYSSGILSRTVGMYREMYPDSHFSEPYAAVDCAAGSFFAVRADVFKKLGYFDEHTFLFYEEDILGFRLKRLGYKEAVLNTCRFVHMEGVSASMSLRKYRVMQKSRIYFHRTYKKAGFFKLLALYLATGLGFLEKSVKAACGAVKASEGK